MPVVPIPGGVVARVHPLKTSARRQLAPNRYGLVGAQIDGEGGYTVPIGVGKGRGGTASPPSEGTLPQ